MCGSMPAHLLQVISVIAFRGQNRSEAQYVVSNSVGRTDGTGIVQQVGAGPGRRSITQLAVGWMWLFCGIGTALWLRFAADPHCGCAVLPCETTPVG